MGGGDAVGGRPRPRAPPLSSCLRQATDNGANWAKEYCNSALRVGLGLLGLRPAAEDEAGTVDAPGPPLMLTPFGAGLWHRAMRHALGSQEAAGGLCMYWSAVPPASLQPGTAWLEGAQLLE